MTTMAAPPPQMPAPMPVAPRRSRLPAFLGYWFVYAVMFLLPVGLFAYAVGVWVPPVREIYKDFKTAIPETTQWVIRYSESVGTLPFWIEAALCAGLASALLAGITALMPRGFLRASIAMISMLAILTLTVVESLLLYSAIWDPLLGLMRSVRGAP
jgi:hypothetical protein